MPVIDLMLQARSWAVEAIESIAMGEKFGLNIFTVNESVPLSEGTTKAMPGWYMTITYNNPIQPLFHHAPIGAISPDRGKIVQEVEKGIAEIRRINAGMTSIANGGSGVPPTH